MVLSYDTPMTAYPDSPPSNIRLQVSRSTGGGPVSMFLDVSYGGDASGLTAQNYLDWLEVVRDALVSDGWTVTAFYQNGETTRDISHTP